jgi:preprotein translocase subunit SecG
VKSALAVIQVILAVLVMLGVLLQTPKASGLGGTIGGGGDIGGGYRRRRGLERSLLRATAVLIGLFVIVSVLDTYYGTR